MISLPGSVLDLENKKVERKKRNRSGARIEEENEDIFVSFGKNWIDRMYICMDINEKKPFKLSATKL